MNKELRLQCLSIEDIKTTTKNGYNVLGYARLGISIKD